MTVLYFRVILILLFLSPKPYEMPPYLSPYRSYTTLEWLLILVIFCWIIGLAVSKFFLNKEVAYIAWSKKTAKGLWVKHWKFFIGVAVGALLMAS